MSCATMVTYNHELEEIRSKPTKSASDSLKEDELVAKMKDHMISHNSGLQLNCQT
jgi:hypothetical protein